MTTATATANGRLLDLELPVEVHMASEEIPLEKLLDLELGGVLPLARDPDSPVDLVVNDVVVASGELVLVDGKFGLRVLSTAMQKLAALDPLQGGKGNS